MKRVFYSLIVILYSIFTITVMINYGYKDNCIDEAAVKYRAVNEEASEAEENSDLAREDNNDNNDNKQKSDADINMAINEADDSNKSTGDKTIQSNEKNSYGSTDVKSGKGKSAEIIDRGERDSYSAGMGRGIGVNDREKEKDGPILKIPAKEIPAKMSLNDKLILLSYSKKLNKEDYEKIINYIKNYNPRNAIKNTFYILDDRLSDEEVEEIKKILSEYINFSNV